MDEVYDAVMDGSSIKKACEKLSWLEPGDLEPKGKQDDAIPQND